MKQSVVPSGGVIGIVGGGQLGRMMIHAASRLGYRTAVYCDKQDSPGCHVANQSVIAPYTDTTALETFADQCDVVTFEFENIPHETVRRLEKRTIVRPCWGALHISQNRLREKEFVNSLGIPTTEFRKVHSQRSFEEALKELGTPCILKTTELGYDGKGQFLVDNATDPRTVWGGFSGEEGILERRVPFEMEISVVACRGCRGEWESFAPVQNIHKSGILETTIAPAEIAEVLAEKAKGITRKIMEALDYVGVLAVEFFVSGRELLVNEIAPRPHNSGHWTLDACVTSQFEQHMRAVCGLPLGCSDWHSRAVMKNLIGADVNEWEDYLESGSTKVHIYAKGECRPGRKMGHVTTLKIG